MRLSKPSPATAISLTALFVALGGTGYAALNIEKNSVTSAAIKKGAVKSSDIASNAVKSRHVKDNALTGNDVDESKLGKVPSAALADLATKADAATAADMAKTAEFAANAGALQGRVSDDFVSTATQKQFFFKMSAPEIRTILTHGAITLKAECLDDKTVQNNNNQDAVRILTETTKNDVYQVSNTGDEYDNLAAAGIRTDAGPDSRELYVFRTANGGQVLSDHIDDLALLGPNLEAIGSAGGEGIFAALNAQGNACIIGGTFWIYN